MIPFFLSSTLLFAQGQFSSNSASKRSGSLGIHPVYPEKDICDIHLADRLACRLALYQGSQFLRRKPRYRGAS